MYAMLATMSNPKSLPVIGHAHKFFNVTLEAIADTLQYFGSFPSPVCIHMGPLPHVAIFDPESVQVVLNSPDCLQKMHQYSFFWVPRTLLCAPVHMWKGQRKALNPAFSSAIIGKIVPVFNKKCEKLMHILDQYVGKQQKDCTVDILKCTLDQIYETSFECEFNMQLSPDGEKTLDIFENFMKLASERICTIWKYPDLIYQWTKSYKKQLSCIDTYYDTILEKVARHIDIDKRINEVNEVDNSTKKHNFIHCLSKYLRSQGPIPREDVLAHFCLIVFAGNESTAKTVSTAMLMLAMHPEIQERCYQEINTVCPGENQYISAGDAANLTYLEMVIKETLRLLPVVPVLGRTATSDVKLNGKIFLR
ncbi:AAEL015591-PA [Aedes aegypti]|uniref:AAEL015591-PA n=1 Tax=Aedes aegypti TaxID=7159 RepID=Q1DGK9_AEDAE|nr:AAEL015591-PA [Aedes aegypti]